MVLMNLVEPWVSEQSDPKLTKSPGTILIIIDQI